MDVTDDQAHHTVKLVVDAAMRVQNALGKHFLERVYECALVEELTLTGVSVESQKPLPVYYRTDKPVATYQADMLVEEILIVEIKAVEVIHPGHRAQVANYLKASRLTHGLVLNFGPDGVKYSKVTL